MSPPLEIPDRLRPQPLPLLGLWLVDVESRDVARVAATLPEPDGTFVLVRYDADGEVTGLPLADLFATFWGYATEAEARARLAALEQDAAAETGTDAEAAA